MLTNSAFQHAAAPGKKGRQSVDGLEAPEVAAAKLKSATIKEVTAALDGLKRAKAKLAAEVPDPQTEGELVSPEASLPQLRDPGECFLCR